jgi:phospholipid/cholesterol/gamma-HCH transport system permease protein
MMLIDTSLAEVGKYCRFMYQVISKPEKWSVFFRRTLDEVNKLGVDSLGIVTLISFFIGAVITIQVANNLDNPFIPKYTVAFAARETIVLEFSATIVCLILAGKVGSNISSEIGTMRITEQIDALDIMGINSAAYLAGPKIVAMIISVPVLVVYSIFIGIIGGVIAGSMTGLVPLDDFIVGLHFTFKPYYIAYSLFKSTLFAFIISSCSSYYGYNIRGGALEVGKASTQSVVISCVLILMVNLMVTQFLLS